MESWPTTFFPVQSVVVRHTVTANDDPDPAATVRAIYFRHAVVSMLRHLAGLSTSEYVEVTARRRNDAI